MKVENAEIRSFLLSRLAGTSSDEENKWLDGLIENDPEVKRLWGDLSQKLGTPGTGIFLQKLDEKQGWQNLQNRLRAKQELTPIRAVKSNRSLWLGIAASLLVAVATLTFYTLKKTPPSAELVAGSNVKRPESVHLEVTGGKYIDLTSAVKKRLELGGASLTVQKNELTLNHSSDELQWSTLVVPARFNYKIVLDDGTQVWLNSVSDLRFPSVFSGTTREVYLKGEAFFKVAKNPQQPFIVHTPKTDIQVLGTSFNVNTYHSGKTITSLVEGSVRTTDGKLSQLLTPGKEALYSDNAFLVKSFEADEVLSWMQGKHYFYDKKLSDVVEILPRWFGVEVVFDDPSLAGHSFTGMIEKDEPLSLFLSNIEISEGITGTVKDGVLHLK